MKPNNRQSAAAILLAASIFAQPASAYFCASAITLSGEIFEDQDVSPADVIASAEHSAVANRGRPPEVGTCIKAMRVAEFKAISDAEIAKLNDLFRDRLQTRSDDNLTHCSASVSVQRWSGAPYIGHYRTTAIIGFGICSNGDCHGKSFFAKLMPSIEHVALMAELYSKRYRRFGNMCLVNSLKVS